MRRDDRRRTVEIWRAIERLARALAASAIAMASTGPLAHLHATPNGADRGAQPLLRHVHGLAYASDGKALLVSSHTGLALFGEGGWHEVDGPIHDFAGFAMAQNAIYASGHPREGSGLPDPLGLVKSTDMGVQWRTLALGGEVDLHLIGVGYRTGAIYVLTDAPNSSMPRPGLHLSLDDGRTWSRRDATGLRGEVFALAAHPEQSEVVAIASKSGIWLSRDAGNTFRQFDGRQAVTAAIFDVDGRTVRYTRATRRELVSAALQGKSRSIARLPSLGLGYVTHLAQNPAERDTLAIATDRRHVYVTLDAGKTWRQIARDGDLP